MSIQTPKSGLDDYEEKKILKRFDAEKRRVSSPTAHASKPNTVKLIGGSHDGETVNVEWWVKVYYISSKISIREYNDLCINDVLIWKHPDDVYIRSDQGDFTYSRTIKYKPD